MPAYSPPTPPPLGARIRQQRRVLNISQGELGARLCPPVSHASVAQVESGKDGLSVARLLDYARVLQVDPCWLLTGRAATALQP